MKIPVSARTHSQICKYKKYIEALPTILTLTGDIISPAITALAIHTYFKTPKNIKLKIGKR